MICRRSNGRIAANRPSGAALIPDLGQNRIARMVDVQPVAGLFHRDAGKQRVSSEPRRGKRKPWAGGHDARINRSAGDQGS